MSEHGRGHMGASEDRQQPWVTWLATGLVFGGILGWLALLINFGDTYASWASAWPGGSAGFLVTLAVTAALSLLLTAVACLLYAEPENAPRWLRMSRPVHLASAVAGSLLALVSGLTLAMALPARTERRGLSCADDALGCFLREDAPGVAERAFLLFGLLLAVGGFVLHRLFRGGRDRRPRHLRRGRRRTADWPRAEGRSARTPYARRGLREPQQPGKIHTPSPRHVPGAAAPRRSRPRGPRR